jgi:hypothetical protein
VWKVDSRYKPGQQGNGCPDSELMEALWVGGEGLPVGGEAWPVGLGKPEQQVSGRLASTSEESSK